MIAALRLWGWGLLLTALLASAVAVIFCKYYTRLLFVEIQQQDQALEQYDVQWGQTQLEASMQAEHHHVEQVAQQKLGLVMPLREKIVYIEEP